MELTPDEETLLGTLESVVGAGIQTFVEVGTALGVIRDRYLYRQTHSTFLAYCVERWGLSRSRAYELIDAAGVVGVVSGIPDTPAIENAGQATALAPVVKEHGPEVAGQVLKQAAAAGKLTASSIKKAIANDPEVRDAAATALIEHGKSEGANTPRRRDPKPRDYGRMVESAVNSLNVALTAAQKGEWELTSRDEALLHFVTGMLVGRRDADGQDDARNEYTDAEMVRVRELVKATVETLIITIGQDLGRVDLGILNALVTSEMDLSIIRSWADL